MTQTRMTTRLPTALADALATRAEANHRSVNGELCAILQAALSGTPEPRVCPYCSKPEGSLHHPDCHTQRKGKSVLSSGCYFAADGTLMNANGTRSIFDDVDK